MIKLLGKRNTLGRLLVVAAILALFLSFIGNVQKNFAAFPADDIRFGTAVKIVLDTVPAAIKVFSAKPRAIAGGEGWVLTIAETLGALVTFSAVLALLWVVLKEQVEKLRISLLRRHTIVLGFGTNAKLFLKSKQRPAGKAVVVIDPTASETIRDSVHAEGCLHFATTDATTLSKRLRACRIGRAERLIIATATDAENMALCAYLAESDLTSLDDIVVDIRDVALHRQLSGNDGFMQSLGAGLRLFNYAKAASVDLMSRTNFAKLAQMHNQQGVCLIIFGATVEAAETVTQYLRSAPSFLPVRPKIVWVVQERGTLEKLLSLSFAPLAELIGDDAQDGALAWCADVVVVEASEARAPYDTDVMAKVLAACDALPTALIVAEDEASLGKTNIQIAAALRDGNRRLKALAIPIFIFSQKKGAEDRFLVCRANTANRPNSQKKLAVTDDLASVIEPFGRSDEVCSWGTVDSARERRAQKLHAQYVADRLKEGDPDAPRAVSLQPWETLSDTYKNANRRAADQMSVLRDAKDDLLHRRGAIGPEEIELLAALEHDAWRIDRALDGWKHGTSRDNLRKYHPDLVPYEDLTDQIKEYDRSKVRAMLES